MTGGPLPGDFAACKVSGAAGTLVRWAEDFNGQFGDWEHAVVYVGGGRCLQAEPGGARIAARGVRAGDIWSTGLPQFALTAEQRARVPALAATYEHVGYSVLDYLALAMHRLRIPAPGLRGYIKSTGHLICSQLADDLELRLGLHLFVSPPRWDGYVTPWDIGNLIREAGGKTIE